MQSFVDLRTLIFVITIMLMCRAAIMWYAWVIAKQYAPVRYWVIGSAMMACGALLIGLRDIVPHILSIILGQGMLIFGWIGIDAGILIAAHRRPPWRVATIIGIAGLIGTYWFLLVNNDFALRTVATSLPGILFDIYAAVACMSAKVGSRTATLRILAGILVIQVISNLLKLAFIVQTNTQVLFAQDWQISQFYLMSVISTAVVSVIFVLLATQRLQEHLKQELEVRKQTESDLNAALVQAGHFREALDNVPSFVYLKDLNSRYTYANKPTLALFGCSREELIGSDDTRFFPLITAKRLREVDQVVFSGRNTKEEIEVPDNANGTSVYLEVKTPVYSDVEHRQINGLCGISTDITELKEHEKQLEHIAHYDSLTKLPNRVLLSDRLSHAIAQSKRRGLSVGVAFLDLDGFKAVNDENGHAIGDELLVLLSRHMMDALRQGDTLARVGGDEFVAVLVDLERATDCEPVLDRLLKASSEPIMIGELRLQVSVSIGITLYPEDDTDPDQLLRHADQMMYQAKNAGKNCYQWYSPILESQPKQVTLT